MVWITCSRGAFVSQISFTPSAWIWGFGEVTPCQASQAWESAPRPPSASATTFAEISVGGV